MTSPADHAPTHVPASGPTASTHASPSVHSVPAARPHAAPTSGIRPPVAQRRLGHRVRDIHGEHFDDPLDWLRDKRNSEVLAHLSAENRWTDAVCAPTAPLASRLTREFRAHTRLADVSAPVRIGDFWYFTRTREDHSYPSHHRVPARGKEAPHPVPGEALEGEELVLDEQMLAEGHTFFRVQRIVPSPDGHLIAWGRDTSGDERWTWVVQEVPGGRIVDEAVSDAGYGLAWSADGRAFLHTRPDEAWRQFELRLHVLGTPQGEDVLLLREEDEGFDLWFEASRDPRWVAIHSTSPTTGQAWLWSREHPSSPPLLVTDREPGVLVEVEPAGDHLVLVHSRTSREGTVALAPIPPEATDPCGAGARFAAAPLAPAETWVSLREAGEGERLLGVEASAHFLLVSMRSGSLTQVEHRTRLTPVRPQEARGAAGDEGASHAATWAPRPLPASELTGVWGEGRFVEVPSPVRCLETGSGSSWEPAPGVGAFFDPCFTVNHESIVQPPRVERIDARTGERTLVKEVVAPGWEASRFVEERVWVSARDGATRIPVTLVHRADVRPDGTNPGWLYGYGAYEVSIDADFSVMRLPVLERGVVWAIAHVRGGGEMGRAWYEDGKYARKVHSFTDFVDVADWLVASGWVAEGRLAAEGRSAGGLLMGAVLNLAPHRFRAVLAGVPFVDALTTILDPSLPLTVGEWEEWGNPVEDPRIFEVMRSYTPCENVPRGVPLPAVMATTALNDTRVFFVEPAKWVQVLREDNPEASMLPSEGGRPVVLRTEMVAGHGGRSGRFGHWEARAEEFAFVLGQIGVEDTRVP